MVLNGSFRLDWIKYPCEVSCGFVGPKIKEPMLPVEFQQRYDLAQKYVLEKGNLGEDVYLQFAGINETSNDEIVWFMSKYGPLGIHKDKLWTDIMLSSPIYNEILEEVSIVQAHIRLMREVINLRNLYIQQSEDIELLVAGLSNMIDIITFLNSQDIPLSSISDDEIICKHLSTAIETRFKDETEFTNNPYNNRLLGGAGLIVTYVVNSFLTHVSCAVIPSPEHKFFGESRPDSLLTAMYVMLYDDLIQGRMIKKCSNEKCSKFFVSTDKRKIYCDRLCADAQGHRNKRKGDE